MTEDVTASTRTYRIDPADILTEHAASWRVNLPSWIDEGDCPLNRARSPWVLLEDDRPLYFPHGHLDEIRHLGRGRYSHWKDHLFFSSSDNTSPRENGRVYTLVRGLPAAQAAVPAVEEKDGVAETFRTLFVAGCGHSGTTLLFNLLKSHPMVMPTNGYPDGEDHDGWIIHGDLPLAGTAGLPEGERPCTGRGQRCLAAGAEEASADRVARLRRYYRDEVLRGHTDRLAVNKTPHISNKLPFIARVFERTRFVHLVRDVGPMVRGWLKEPSVQGGWLYWPEVPDPCLWVVPPGAGPEFPADPDRFITPEAWRWLVHYWVETNRTIATFAETAPERVLRLRYEDLCRDPAAVLDRLYAFVGLPPLEMVPTYPPIGSPTPPSDAWTAECEAAHPKAAEVRRLFGYR